MSARDSRRDASHNGTTSHRVSEPASSSAARDGPPENLSSARDAGPNAAVPFNCQERRGPDGVDRIDDRRGDEQAGCGAGPEERRRPEGREI